MKRTWKIVGVRDVPGSFKWYQSLFGQPETPPGHDDFGQILDTDGTILLCLHRWGAHEHLTLMSPEVGRPKRAEDRVWTPRQARRLRTMGDRDVQGGIREGQMLRMWCADGGG
jgi:hypothetical protein